MVATRCREALTRAANAGRDPWVAVIVGAQSGTVRPVPFATFRSADEAQRWAHRMNRQHEHLNHLSFFSYGRNY